MEMPKCFLLWSSFGGFLSIALGAFGAHALKSRLDDYHLGVFHTGVQYQFFHSIALAIVALLLLRENQVFVKVSGYFFAAGIIVFSGSLYALALSGVKLWGAITPIGGLSFLIGWCLMGVGIFQMSWK